MNKTRLKHFHIEVRPTDQKHMRAIVTNAYAHHQAHTKKYVDKNKPTKIPFRNQLNIYGVVASIVCLFE